MNIDRENIKELNKKLKQDLSFYLKQNKIISNDYTGEIILNVSQGTVGKINIAVIL